MKSFFKNLTIKTQLYILLGVFAVLTITHFLVVTTFQGMVEKNGMKTDLATDLLPIIRTVGTATGTLSESDQDLKNSIKKKISKGSNIIEIFDHGGKLPNAEIYIDAEEGNSRHNLNHLSLLWDSVRYNVDNLIYEPHTLDSTFQETVQISNNDSLNTTRSEIVSKTITVDNPLVKRARAFVSDNSEELTNRAQLFKNGLEEDYKRAEKLLHNASLTFTFLPFIVIVFVVIAGRKIILEPLRQLSNNTDNVSQGNFKVDTSSEFNNEINHISKKLDKLANNLKHATTFVKHVGEGKLDEEFVGIEQQHVSSESLEGALLNMREQMKNVEEDEQIRKWSTEGLAKFVDILRTSNDNVAELSDKIISSLIDYTKSNQGGLYLLNSEDESNEYLELVSLYAFDIKKFDQKRIKLGEGLVGQTFLERKTTYLLEVPNDYITIRSGLGGANPKAILVVPLQVNEEIFGIIELASFQEFEPYEIEFVEKLGESIASTIAAVRNNQKTKRLLGESQELTEQMQAQEEEMRQNMEELSATQEEMARKEIELTAQLTAINNSVGTAEYDMDGTIITTNLIFAQNLGYTKEEMPDKTLGNLCSAGGQIWPSLMEGNDQSGEFEFNKKSGEEVVVQSSFTPIKNNQGDFYKVIQLVMQFGQRTAEKTDEWAEIEHIEHALKQNLEEMEITQEQLDRKLKNTESTLMLVNEIVSMVVVNHYGNIISTNLDLDELSGRPVSFIGNIDFEEIKSNKPSMLANTEVVTKSGNRKNKTIHLSYSGSEDDSSFNVCLIWI